jgi:hypothetical protein
MPRLKEQEMSSDFSIESSDSSWAVRQKCRTAERQEAHGGVISGGNCE